METQQNITSLPSLSDTRNIPEIFDVNFFISIVLLQFAFILGN